MQTYQKFTGVMHNLPLGHLLKVLTHSEPPEVMLRGRTVYEGRNGCVQRVDCRHRSDVVACIHWWDVSWCV